MWHALIASGQISLFHQNAITTFTQSHLAQVSGPVVQQAPRDLLGIHDLPIAADPRTAALAQSKSDNPDDAFYRCVALHSTFPWVAARHECSRMSLIRFVG